MVKKISLSLLVLVMALVPTSAVRALELEISNNGGGSDSEVTVVQTTETTVVQENRADVGNQVETSSNTGENTAGGNTNGDVAVMTGDVNTAVVVESSANASVVSTGCCNQPSTVKIASNGAGSQNAVSLHVSSQNTVGINQDATIINKVNGSANTGRNSADNNTGASVWIKTGDIKAYGKVVNDPVNLAYLDLKVGLPGVNALIFGNGAGSVNQILAVLPYSNNLFINNTSRLINLLTWDLNTGNNHASGNTGGEIAIETGDIDLTVLIKNLANIGGIKVDCCPSVPPVPTPPPGNGGDGGDGNGDGGGDGGGNGAAGAPGAAAAAAGPGIMGLADTSGSVIPNLFFLAGLVALAVGIKLTGEALKVSPYRVGRLSESETLKAGK